MHLPGGQIKYTHKISSKSYRQKDLSYHILVLAAGLEVFCSLFLIEVELCSCLVMENYYSVGR